jgi:hypothetical protein
MDVTVRMGEYDDDLNMEMEGLTFSNEFTRRSDSKSVEVMVAFHVRGIFSM